MGIESKLSSTPNSKMYYERGGYKLDFPAATFDQMMLGQLAPADGASINEAIYSVAGKIARAANFDFSQRIMLDPDQSGLVFLFGSVAFALTLTYRFGVINDFFFARCPEITGYKGINIETGLGFAISPSLPDTVFVNNANYGFLFAEIQTFLRHLSGREDDMENARNSEDPSEQDLALQLSRFVNRDRPY